MEKCYYHPKTAAVTTCVGCKMTICATCRDEGSKGLCDQCTRKRQSVEPGAKDAAAAQRFGAAPARRGTGSLAGGASPPPAGRPGAGQRADVVYCFRHEDIRAAATCTTCKRNYCPACLNSAGICAVCARINKDAQAIAFGPNERGRAVLEEVAAEERAKRLKPRDYAVIVFLVVGVGLSYKMLHKPKREVDQTTQTLTRAKTVGLSSQEAALLASIRREKRVQAKDPPVAAGTAPGGVPVVDVGGGGRPAGGGQPGGAPPGADQPLEIRATYPADGAIVGGVAVIRAAIAGNPQRVTCEVDGVLIGSSSGAGPSFAWNTRSAGSGPHQVTITAFGGGGSTSSTFGLNVLNR